MRLLLLGAVLMVAGGVVGADRKVVSRVGFSLQGCMARMHLDQDDATSAFGYGGGGALVYELNRGHFIFQTGVGLDLTWNPIKYQVAEYRSPIVEYPQMDYVYDYRNYRETYRYGMAYVPLLFGGEFGHFYFLMGAKVGFYSLLGQARISSDMTLWAQDKDVIDPLTNQPTHYLVDYQLENTEAVDYRPLNVMGSAELGLTFGRKLTRVRLALFADYGFMNLHRYTANGGMMHYQAVNQVVLHTALGYEPYKDNRLTNLTAGLKLTVLFCPQRKPEEPADTLPTVVPQKKDTVVEERVDSIVEPAVDTTREVIEVDPVKHSFTLRNMFFATARTEVLPSSQEALDMLYRLLAANPNLRIEILGHTDNVDTEEFNQLLSENRALSVRHEMVLRGISGERIRTSGRGEKDFVAPNDTEQHRQMNRRVEIILLNPEQLTNTQVINLQLSR